jgi:hypothetical protein
VLSEITSLLDLPAIVGVVLFGGIAGTYWNPPGFGLAGDALTHPTAASGALRRLLPGWRAVHAAFYLTFTFGLLHGLIAGTDAGSPFTLAFYLAALLAVGWATYRRLFSEPPLRSTSKKVSAGKAPVNDPWPMPDTTKGRDYRVARRLMREIKGGADRGRAA